MSDEPIALPQPAPDRWGQPISQGRQAQLDTLAEQQRAWVTLPEQERGDSHFKGVKLSGADVFCLAARALAESMKGDIETAAAGLRHAMGRHSSDISKLHLEGADLRAAHLEGAALRRAHLEGAELGGVHLERAILTEAHLERAALNGVHLEGAELMGAHLEQAILSFGHLAGAAFTGALLAGAFVNEAHLEGADLSGAHLERADLNGAHLERADLRGAYLAGAAFIGAYLEGATLRAASFDKSSRLNEVHFDGVNLDQVIFDNTNLAVIEWGRVHRLGDEIAARRRRFLAEKADLYHAAARAYRALATALRTQGLGTEATRFHFRAELMARYEHLYAFLSRLFSRRFYTAPSALGQWLVSWLLGVLAGYGDRLDRLLVTYLVTVSVFAALMFAVAGRAASFDSIRDVFVLSITSFHGRGVQPPGLRLTDALATLTAIEAFFGLAIEGIFIAAFTRRVTGN